MTEVDAIQKNNSDQEHKEPHIHNIDTALIIAFVPIFASSIRIWLYSGGDMSLFLVLLRTLNIVSVMVGTIFVVMPGLITAIMVIAFADKNARRSFMTYGDSNPWLFRIILPASAITIIYTLSWTNLLLMTGIVTIFSAFLLLRHFWLSWRPRGVRERAGISLDSVAMIFSVLATLLILPSNMWLPAERIMVGDELVTGHVLEVDSSWTTILDKERKLYIIPSDEIKTRKVCAWGGNGTVALLLQKGGLEDAAKCS